MRDVIDIKSNDNALFVTSQCNNRCLMCCQPPIKVADIDENFAKNTRLISDAPQELIMLGITGGEPTLLESRLFDLISEIRIKLPNTFIHLLTNGRRFADKKYTRQMYECGVDKLLVGIPIHSDFDGDHDKITQVKGSFNETMRGLYNLGRYDFDIELRIVINKINYHRLPSMANFIYRNLPFVNCISLMGLESTGYAIKNRDSIWVEPLEYEPQLVEAVYILDGCGLDVAIFNVPHCLLPKQLWQFAKQSISDWKTKYEPFCVDCIVRSSCCGLFGTSKLQHKGLHPIR